MNKKIVAAMLFLLCLIVSPTSGEEIRYKKITSNDGLCDMIVQTIYRDSTGYVWFGTLTGIDRYDGIYIRHYPFHDSNESGKSTYDFHETPRYGLLAGASNGLWRLNRNTNRFEKMFDGRLNHVHSIESDGESIYIGTENGLFSLYRNKLSPVSFGMQSENHPATNRIEDMCVADDRMLWIATRNGLVCYNPVNSTSKIYRQKSNQLRNNNFQCVAQIDGDIYLGTADNGLIKFDPQSGQFSKYVDVGCLNIKDIDIDGDLIYVSTDGNGLQIVSRSKQAVVRSHTNVPGNIESISSNSVYCFLKDRFGVDWIGLYLGGVNHTYYNNGLFKVYSYKDFDSRNYSVRSMVADNDRMLVGTRNGLFFISEKRGIVHRFEGELHSAIITSLIKHKGKFYAGVFNHGLWEIDPVTVKASRPSSEELLTHNDIYSMSESRDGHLWMATGSGVLEYDTDNGQLSVHTPQSSSLPSVNTHYIAFDRHGNGWIAGQSGLSRYDAGMKRIRTDFPEGYDENEFFFYIYPDAHDNIFLLTYKNIIVSKSDMTGRRTLQPDSTVGRYMAVAEDFYGNYWFSTNTGIYRTDEPDNPEKYIHFGLSDNLPDMYFNQCVVRDSVGRLWFGNSRGLCYVEPAAVDSVRKAAEFPVVFSSVSVDNKPLSDRQYEEFIKVGKLRLVEGQRSFTLSPVLLNFSDYVSRKYEYILEGYDDEWSIIDDGKLISYTNLPKGRYKLVVRVKGSDAVSEISVAVGKGFGGSVWGLLGCIISVILVVVIYHKFRGQGRDAVIDDTDKYKNTRRLSVHEAEIIISRLERCMNEDKMYLNPDLKSADLARAVDCSPAILSQIFTLHLGVSYYDFINTRRVDEFKMRVGNGEYNKYTLSALARVCGFNSQASFFRSFKKITGMTPSEYIAVASNNDGREHP